MVFNAVNTIPVLNKLNQPCSGQGMKTREVVGQQHELHWCCLRKTKSLCPTYNKIIFFLNNMKSNRWPNGALPIVHSNKWFIDAVFLYGDITMGTLCEVRSRAHMPNEVTDHTVNTRSIVNAVTTIKKYIVGLRWFYVGLTCVTLIIKGTRWSCYCSLPWSDDGGHVLWLWF